MKVTEMAERTAKITIWSH